MNRGAKTFRPVRLAVEQTTGIVPNNSPLVNRKLAWRSMSLAVLCGSLGRGWRWGADVRRGGHCLISPRGSVFEFDRGPPLRVRAYRERRFLDAA